ncbi:cyclic nucleotide-binding domain-containing protein [Spirochaeta africana]|uniref:cAMP-binding protein n=1 Tax=Spirochaeta africana (strain ATCC 700263 / DSM 8902 / Z-7692) TaxID=889378 RepID=H9UJT9_SPIAZ|nr:cyclic nucleotide-binding domain-containing protein [Spirochaeta africana]AFG37782.1 cAMP-binding protein [Spirochaeta africana DSM 8902]
MKSRESTIQRLQSITLFGELKDNPAALESIARICSINRTAAGKRVIKEGEVGTSLYIMNAGSVEIHKHTRAGDEYTVVQLDAGDNVFFGELALIDDDRRSATVVTTSDAEFLVIEKKDFLALGNAHPEIGLPVTRAIARIIAARLRKTTEDMLSIFDALVEEVQGS